MRIVVIRGTPREVGVQLGQVAEPVFAGYLKKARIWKKLQPWKDSKYLKLIADHVKKTFPFIWDMIEGMAEALHMDPMDILLHNCRGDLMHTTDAEGCTSGSVSTVSNMPKHGGRWITHNEDGDPKMLNHCFIADITMTFEDDSAFPWQQKLGHVGFCYPGSLPGHTYSANRRGLVQTINNIRIKHMSASIADAAVEAGQITQVGLPRMVVSLAVMSCSCIDHARDVLRNYQPIGAFHYLLSCVCDKEEKIWSIESTPMYCSELDVTAVTSHSNDNLTQGQDEMATEWYAHANHLEHRTVSQRHPGLPYFRTAFPSETAHIVIASALEDQRKNEAGAAAAVDTSAMPPVPPPQPSVKTPPPAVGDDFPTNHEITTSSSWNRQERCDQLTAQFKADKQPATSLLDIMFDGKGSGKTAPAWTEATGGKGEAQYPILRTVTISTVFFTLIRGNPDDIAAAAAAAAGAASTPYAQPPASRSRASSGAVLPDAMLLPQPELPGVVMRVYRYRKAGRDNFLEMKIPVYLPEEL